MTYPEALAYVASLLPRGWRLGLDRMNELVRRSGLEHVAGEPGGPQFIHVAGTNGKGSVTAFLQSMLIESGYRTGAFFSPYVYEPRERIQFGRDMISEQCFAAITVALQPEAESLCDTEFGGATEFEFKTAMGLKYWAEKRCEWVALEVGLGGRLDATNVVTPRASVIVSIGLDHTSVLGSTLEEIAAEKAGIIKDGVPVMVGEMPAGPMSIIESIAYERGAPMWRLGREILLEEGSDGWSVTTPLRRHTLIHSGLAGTRQPHNLALAVAALDASGAFKHENGIRIGALRASLPGRFERRTTHSPSGVVVVVLDGAHNADAASALVENLATYYPGKKAILITGMVAGHDAFQFYDKLRSVVRAPIIVPIDFHRAVPPAELAPILEGIFDEVIACASVEEGISRATAMAGDLILVTGSFYLVGEVGRRFL